MTWTDSLSAAGLTAAFIGGLIWLTRNWLLARLTHSIQHEYNNKLAILQSQLTRQEENHRQELQQRISSLESVASQALSGSAERQSLIFRKKIESIDTIISAIDRLASGRAAADLLAPLKLDKVDEENAKTGKLKPMLEAIKSGIDFDSLKSANCDKCRPYVSPMCWASFQAYKGTVMYAVGYVSMATQGFDRSVLDPSKLLKLAKTALPAYSQNFDNFGISAAMFLLDKLEESIYIEIDTMLDGSTADKHDLVRAAEILIASKDLIDSASAAIDSDK